MKIQCVQTGMLGVNTYIVWDEETKKGFLLDPGDYDRLVEKIIKNENIDIEYIILTHGHGDHIGGVESGLRENPKAKLLAFTAEADLLKDPRLNFSLDCAGEEISLDADIYVNDGDALAIGNMTLKFLHTPGHTKGGMCVLIDDTLFSGDTLFRMSVGRTDFPGGSFRELETAIREKLYVLPDETKVLPDVVQTKKYGVFYKKVGIPFLSIFFFSEENSPICGIPIKIPSFFTFLKNW